MTVAEMIDLLSRMPQDVPIVIETGDIPVITLRTQNIKCITRPVDYGKEFVSIR